MTIAYGLQPWDYGLVLDMTFEEGAGVMAYDRSRSGHQMVLNGPPAWTQIAPSDLTVLDFDETNPDWLDASAAATNIAMNFTAGSFSMGGWINIDSLAANRNFLCRGLLNTDGYHCQVLMDGSIAFFTNQGGANQVTISFVDEIVTTNWYQIGITRDEGAVHIFKNGLEVTETVGVHLDPLTCARELHIGIYDNETGSPWAGMMWRPRVWRNVVVPDYHWQLMFAMERGLFGV